MKIINNLTDVEINAIIAEWMGYKLEPDGSWFSFFTEKYHWASHPINLHVIAEVKAKLRDMNIGYKIIYHEQTKRHSATLSSERFISWDDDENRVFCLAVCAMIRGKTDNT